MVERDDHAILKQFRTRLESARKHADVINERKRHAHRVTLGTSHPDYRRARRENDPTDWHSRNFPAVAYEHKQLLVAEIAQPPEFEAEPAKPAYRDGARAIDEVLTYFLEQMEFDRTHAKAADQAVEYGGAHVLTGWRKITETETIEQETPILAEDGVTVIDVETTEVEDEIVLYDGPWIELIRYEDSLPDPTAKEADQAKWWIRRWYATKQELEAAGIYDNLDALPEFSGGDRGRDQRRPDETDEAYEARLLGVQTLYDMWTPYGVTTVANEQVIIRHDQNPKDPIFKHRKIPIDVVRLIEDDNNLDGLSAMLLIEEDQEAYWKFWNSLIDSITWAVNPPRIADTEEDPNAAKQVLYPGCTLHARNGKQTLQIMQDLANLNYQGMQTLLQFVRDHIERVTGMNATVAGLANSSSATEASTNLEQAKGRIRLEIDTMDRDWSRVMRKVVRNIQQYADDDIIGRITMVEGQPPVDIFRTPEELQGQFRIRIKMQSERALLEKKINNLTTLWNSIQPQLQPGTVDIVEPARRIFMDLAETMGIDVSEEDVKTIDQFELQTVSGQINNQLQAEAGEAQMQQQLQMQQASMEMMPPEPAAPAQ